MKEIIQDNPRSKFSINKLNSDFYFTFIYFLLKRGGGMFYRITILILISSFISFGGTTGKIAGKVTDANSNEPLPGINIIVQGTNYGTATDVDGNYLLINLPAGKYTLIFSGVGFQKKTFTDVKVVSDFTTNLDVKLSTESIEVETIVVQAEAPLVRKDLTSSHTSLDASQIESLPVESVTQILTLQAGVTQGVGGELHIRGGRSNEIGYTINDMAITNPYDHSKSVIIATNAIQELSVISGTFNAEYGNALSGIVNTVTKEGSTNKYSLSYSFNTGDYLSNSTKIFKNIDNFDWQNNSISEFTASGPIPFFNEKLSFFLSGRYDYDKGYLYGRRQHLISDSVSKSVFNPNNFSISANGDNKLVSMNHGFSFSGTGKLTYRPISTIKINYDFLYSNSEYKPYVHDLKYNPDAVNTRFNWSMLHILEVRQALNNSSFYTLRASFNVDDFKRYLFPLLDKNNKSVDFYAGMSLNGLHADPRYEPDYKSTVRAAPVSFSYGGTYESGGQSHFYQRSKIWAVKFDYTNQLNKSHELKLGGQFRTYVINAISFDILRDSTKYLIPTIAPKSSNRNNSYQKKPYEYSAYIQDKMEFEKLVLNLGVRFDYFKSNSRYSTNIFYPTPNQPGIPSFIDKNSLLADAKAKYQISPRLGVSFPITDKGIIHFSYGHFFQLPPLTYLYANSEYEYSFGTPTYGNANLNPEKTVSYELGLQQQLTDNLAFNLTGYYKDVRDLLAAQQIRISGEETYFTYVNKDYANIRGIIFSLTKRRTASDMLGLTLDYTFQTSEGNDVNADAFFLDLSSGRQSEKIPVLLSWDKTHQLNGTVSVGESSDWNVTLVGKIGTGLPYTPELFGKQVSLKPNSDRRPIISTVDLLAEKSFQLGDFDFTIFLKVYNLFDQLNENIVYANSGRAGYTLDETRGPAIQTDEIAKTNPLVKTSKEVYTRPDFYLPPREVRIGVSIEY